MTRTTFRLSVALPSQREEIELLLRRAFAPYVQKLGRTLSPQAYDWLPSSLSDGLVYTATDDGALVGAVATERLPDGLKIDQIGVLPDRQGTGVGTWLLNRVADTARSQGHAALFLDTAEMMSDLLRLYRRHGFAEIRRGPPDHGRDGHIRVYLRKPL